MSSAACEKVAEKERRFSRGISNASSDARFRLCEPRKIIFYASYYVPYPVPAIFLQLVHRVLDLKILRRN